MNNQFINSNTTASSNTQVINSSKGISLSNKPANSSSGSVSLYRFHKYNKDGVPTNVYDERIFQDIIANNHIRIIVNTPYIYRNGVYMRDEHGTKLKKMIKEHIYAEIVTAPKIERVYNLFIQSEDLRVYDEDGFEVGIDGMNHIPKHWIPFKNGIYDPKNKVMIPHDPKYLIVNLVPHEFDPDASINYDEIDKWLNHVASKEDEREMVLQYAGYCLTRDTSQQKFLILQGEGGTGKSVYIDMVKAMVGVHNCSSLPLETLTQRFSAYELLGKQLNLCADIKTKIIDDVSLLKQVVGEDLIRGEKKHETGFSFTSYARLLFSANKIPCVKDERTNGFYRRLLIHKMMEAPAKRDTDYKEKLVKHMDAFIHRCVDALERMYAAGHIMESQTSIEEVNRVRYDSDSVAAFIEEKCCLSPGGSAQRTKLAVEYQNFCQDEERQALSKTNLFSALRARGFCEKKINGSDYFGGLCLLSEQTLQKDSNTKECVGPDQEAQTDSNTKEHNEPDQESQNNVHTEESPAQVSIMDFVDIEPETGSIPPFFSLDDFDSQER